MKIMVVGGGGREHAIIKKLKENKDIELIPKINGKDHYFTRVSISLLKAINKQIEELGW